MKTEEFLHKNPHWREFFQNFSQEVYGEIAKSPNARCLGLFCENPEEWEIFRLGIDNSIQQSPQLELARNEVVFSFSSPLFQSSSGFEVAREIVGSISEDEGEILQEVLGESLKERVNLYDLQSRDVLLLHLPLNLEQQAGITWSELQRTFERWSQFWKGRGFAVPEVSFWRLLWNPAKSKLSLEVDLSEVA